jgi:Na+/H+ antiporter NhaD/arsenite permease-like protein
MLQLVLTALFLVGYVLISLEVRTGINKGAVALIMSALMWTALMVLGALGAFPEAGASHEVFEFVLEKLQEHTGEVSGILFFLIGAMTIVEVVDHYHGFRLITDAIRTQKLNAFIWISSWVTFFLSAVLDNLTTTIVMMSLLKNLVASRQQRWLLASMIVIAANAGGAWSPIGDVTTTMLWIGGQVTPVNIILKLIIPSVICLIVPLGIVSLRRNRRLRLTRGRTRSVQDGPPRREQNIMLVAGILGLVFVPVFKSLTHLPPYIGILLSMSVLWVITEYLKHRRTLDSPHFTFESGLRRIDMPSVFFFLGILLAIGALETAGTLDSIAHFLEKNLADKYVLSGLVGVLSAIVDNVPLVAAFQQMFNYPPDDLFWEGLAYAAGTGGSLLIIGSAAGVAAMGVEHITFGWYLRHIAGLAFMGYIAGLVSYFLLNQFVIIHF